MPDEITRPIIGIEHRTAQEVFDIMCERFRGRLPSLPSDIDGLVEELERGLEGVTPGPWTHYRDKLRPQFSARINEVQGHGRTPVVAWGGFDNSSRSEAKHAKNAAHIARCHPDNIRKLIAALRARQAPEGVEEAAHAALPPDRQLYVTKDDLRTALSAMPSGAVKVRKLEWELTAPASYKATAIGLRYYLYGGKDGGWRAYTEGYQPAVFGTFATIAEGMNACQADYDTRILSAVESQPS